jgi:hypothetical protein
MSNPISDRSTQAKNQQDLLRYLILAGLLGGLFVHSFWKYGILNQAIGFILPKASAQVPYVDDGTGFIPDWSRIRFIDMVVQDSGSVTYQGNRGNETRAWQSGQSIAEFLELGDFEDSEFRIEDLTISGISNVSNLDLGSYQLSNFQLLEWQTLADLNAAIPNLGNKYVSTIPPIRQLVSKVTGFSGGNRQVKDVIRDYRLNKATFGKNVNLDNYQLTSIPGLIDAPLKKFRNWQDSRIDGIPGLSSLGWDNFPGIPSVNTSFVGKVDLPLGDLEANRSRSISGSFQEGFNVPCLQPSCAHFEAAGPGTTTGMQWISGKSQQVRGGFGILKALNAGKEPTGRNPFGTAFKQVVWEINEAEGSVQTAMFFRICKTIPFVGRTCSPYFIGPVPFIKYQEKDPIIFGNPVS